MPGNDYCSVPYLPPAGQFEEGGTVGVHTELLQQAFMDGRELCLVLPSAMLALS